MIPQKGGCLAALPYASSSESLDDHSWMNRALTLAERGWGRVHPNPLVGAVVVRGGVLVAEGWHGEYGEAHAEAMALTIAGDAARGATLYVTLEPCAHQGRQPPCVDAIVASGVTRVVYAIADPNPTARGGARLLAEHGIAVTPGVSGVAAAQQNARFLHRFAAPSRPFVAVKLAVSMDGMIADGSGQPRWISGAAARDWVHHLRAGYGAIGVGGRTAIADSARLTVRGVVMPRIAPRRVVFDRSGQVGPTLPMLHDGGESSVIVVHGPDVPRARRDALEQAGADVVQTDDLATALDALAVRGIDALLVEGGGRLAGALLAADLIDRIYQVQCPVWLGRGVPAWPGTSPTVAGGAASWRATRREALGDDTLIVLER